jgi:5-methylthioribose kinase
MSLRAEAVATHPGFPWLADDDPAGVASYLRARGFLSDGETPERVERAGEGNMNLTLRIVTGRHSLILKQARPWVEKYDHIAAPWERARFERRFYERVAAIPAVAAAMPRLLGSDDEAHTLLLEDLPGARDLTDLYAGARLDEAEVEALAGYLAALHAATHGTPDPDFANRAMRELNYAHIFVVPYERENGVDLEGREPGLTAAAERLAADGAFRGALAATGRRYLADGPCLLHGDYFPGSWLRTAAGPRVIDPEFCFYGDPEVDAGCALAHLALARQDPGLATRFRARYGACDEARTARFAAAEIARRLLGVAQLPIAPSDGWRAAILLRAREAMVAGSLAGLHA